MNLLNMLEENFLRCYFQVECLTGKNNKTLFNELANVYMLSNETCDELYDIVKSEAVNNIATEIDYDRHQRIKEVFYLNGSQYTFDSKQEEIIKIKGQAMKLLIKEGYNVNLKPSQSEAINFLVSSSYKNKIISLRLFGLIQALKIIETYEDKSLKTLEKAANWNDVDSILMCLYFNKKSRDEYLSHLYTLLNNLPTYYIFERANSFYRGINIKFHENTYLLQKLIGSEQLNPNVYVPKYARILMSTLINEKDKRKIVFGNQDVLDAANDLPLCLMKNKVKLLVYQGQSMVSRKDEQDKIINKIAKQFNNNCYNALCLINEDAFLLEDYYNHISLRFKDANIVKIDVSQLKPFDLESSRHNILVRSCEEDKANIYVFIVHGDVNSNYLNAIKSFANNEERKAFFLSGLGISIDLSSVYPIFLCDSKNAKHLKILQTIFLKNIENVEKEILLSKLIKTKTEEFGVEVEFDKNSLEHLYALSLKDASETLTSLLSSVDCNKVITISELTQYREDHTIYGFGGYKNV